MDGRLFVEVTPWHEGIRVFFQLTRNPEEIHSGENPV